MGPGMFELMLPPRDCNGDNFDRDCLGCRDYQDTCCVNTNCASLRKCEWNNEAWRCNSYIFGWMGEKTEQEVGMGPGMFELMLPPRDCNGDNFDRDCLGCRDYQDTCCVNTNCASLRKCEWNNEAG